MKFTLHGEEMEGKVYSIDYPNDLMNGIYVDFTDDYIFLSDVCVDHREYIEYMEDEVMEHFDLTQMDIDLDKAPHSWIIKSLTNVVIKSAEILCMEACDEA